MVAFSDAGCATRLSGRSITGDPLEPVDEDTEFVGVRKWESPTAGHAFDLEGPDAQAHTMPPAPELDSEELIAEMCEVYGMALLRDVPFADFDAHPLGTTVQVALDALPWFSSSTASLAITRRVTIEM